MRRSVFGVLFALVLASCGSRHRAADNPWLEAPPARRAMAQPGDADNDAGANSDDEEENSGGSDRVDSSSDDAADDTPQTRRPSDDAAEPTLSDPDREPGEDSDGD